MKYLRKFNTLDEYTAVKDNLILPCTSLIAEDYSVKFDAWKDTRLDEYFTIESLEDGNEIIYNGFSGAENSNYDLYYSLDNGVTWNYKTQSGSVPLVTLNFGERVLLYHVGNYQNGMFSTGNCFINPSKTFNVRGNILSMVWGQNFKDKTEFKSTAYNGGFEGFFKQSKVVSAKDLMLPVTTLINRCYIQMFYGCTSLTTAPELPATTLANQCYYEMFMNCTSLTTAPELPVTTLVNSCYSEMFMNCTNLNYIKCLATDISASSCTSNWVNNVAASGTFIKNASMSGWSTGISGIPSGWTQEDYTPEE